MKKFIAFAKKHSWVWIIVVVIVSIVGDAIITQKNKPVPTPTPVPKVADYKSVIPGISTESDLNKILGTPVKTTIDGNRKLDEYKSTSELRLHNAVIENDKVIFIKEIISSYDTTKSSDLTSLYGEPPVKLYSKFPNASFYLYVFPSNGIAYLGHTDGTLLEIWYFIPTTIQEFLSKWATEYSTSPPTEVVQ